LTEPGAGYIGGDDFFGAGSSNLLRDVDINEITSLTASNQPRPAEPFQ